MQSKILCLILSLLVLAIILMPSQAEMSNKEWHQTYKLFIKEYSSPGGQKDNDIRFNAMQYLASADHPRLIDLFIKIIIPFELEHGDPMMFDLIAQILGQLEEEKTINHLLKKLDRTPTDIKIPLILGMGKIEHPGVTKTLFELIEDRHDRIRIAAIKALDYTHPKGALTLVIKALADEHWEVRLSAINYLARTRDKKSKELATEALRSHQPKETKRLKPDISRALSKLNPKKPSPGDHVAFGGTTALFYGLPIESRNVVFVVDVSGSMSFKNKQGEPKIDVLKEQLIKAIERLSLTAGYGKKTDAKFTIISFNQQVKIWKKELVSAREYRDNAIRWVKSLSANGATNLYDALEMAFSLNKQKGTGYFQKSEIEAIFLMSDGSPSAGKYQKTPDILKAVRVLNQIPQIKINTISIKPGNNALMKPLAKQNNGIFIEK